MLVIIIQGKKIIRSSQSGFYLKKELWSPSDDIWKGRILTTGVPEGPQISLHGSSCKIRTRSTDCRICFINQFIKTNSYLGLRRPKSRIWSLSKNYFSVCKFFVVEENLKESRSIKFTFPFIFPSTFKTLASGFFRGEKWTREKITPSIDSGFTFPLAIRIHLAVAWKRRLVHLCEDWIKHLWDMCPLLRRMFPCLIP